MKKDYFTLGKIVIFKEKANVISPKPVWVAFHECWMYSSNTLIGLLWTMFTQWKHDSNLAG